MYQQLLDAFIQREQLPSSYGSDALEHFVPLAQDIARDMESKSQRPFFLGINGAQGTGKSTLAQLIALLLHEQGYRAVTLSLDDFYFSKARRMHLAEEVHPLLRVRGVPGTHDIDLALEIFDRLSSATSAESIILPSFDKASDDCLAAADCRTISGPIDAVILEGWCVGAAPQAGEALETAINVLERCEDPQGRWRRYVNDALAGGYQRLFAQLDRLVLLEAPGFTQVLQWRCLQEEKLRARSVVNAAGLMDDAAIERFIQHFERLTRHCLNTLPQSAETVFKLDAQHRIHSA